MLEDFVGRSVIEYDEASAALYRRTAALLNTDEAFAPKGGLLPFPWSAMLFPAIAPQSEIGPDGHPKRGDFLPPVPLPNRRFAGRTVEILHPVHVGDALTRISTIQAITPKSGKSGPLVFVTVKHVILCSEKPLQTVSQDIVYLAKIGPRIGSASYDFPDPQWTEAFLPDEVMLFRYSALTFNGHRIHYDKDYATAVEGYPALVVNGGLTTLRLLELARNRLTRPVARYVVRATRPLFVGRSASLHGAMRQDGTAVFWCLDDEGSLAMQIDVTT